MERKIVFAEGCMKGCYDVDRQALKEKVIYIISKAEDYIDSIEDYGSGKVLDKEQNIFIKFFVARNKLVIDQVEQQVCVC